MFNPINHPRQRVCAYESEALGSNRLKYLQKGGDFSIANGHLYETQNHATYTCKYHLVWTPKYRGKMLADRYIKQELKRMFKMICDWKTFQLHAWHIGDDHIHLVITIPPKYSVAYALAILKGKTSTWLKKKTKKLPSGTLWERGYFVSTIGADELVIKRYVENQHLHHSEWKQPSLFDKVMQRTKSA